MGFEIEIEISTLVRLPTKLRKIRYPLERYQTDQRESKGDPTFSYCVP